MRAMINAEMSLIAGCVIEPVLSAAVALAVAEARKGKGEKKTMIWTIVRVWIAVNLATSVIAAAMCVTEHVVLGGVEGESGR